LYTDEGKLSQILRNLISNALKFTRRGYVRLTAEPELRGFVVFRVEDTGVGIAPEDQERIFEEFVQIESELQTRVKGTGLGLPLSKRLAELLGGSISVKSEPGLGSGTGTDDLFCRRQPRDELCARSLSALDKLQPGFCIQCCASSIFAQDMQAGYRGARSLP
jgi:signal transduction histidine kinase